METYTQVANAIYLTVAILIAAGSIFTCIFLFCKFIIKIKTLNKEIDKLKKEDTLQCFALSACLDGLIQLGANHTVPIAKNKLDKYLNEQAHDQE